MNTLKRLSLCAALSAIAAIAQTNALTQTTLSAAALASDRSITVTSATGINAPSQGTIGSELYVIAPGSQRGEVMLVQAVSSTTITVARGRDGVAGAIPNGARVLIGQPNYFRNFNPSGGCTAAATFITPHVNTKTGEEFLCSTIELDWVPGWNNVNAPAGVTAAVASAAGQITPSGPLFHITGTAAITGFVLPVGFAGGSFCAIPDAIFTWTAANNIALAGTAVVNKTLCFTYEWTLAKWTPSYIA
jgi:hypothetical protein